MTIFKPGLYFISTFLLIVYFLEYARTAKASWNSEVPCPDLPNCNCSKHLSSSYDLFCPKVENPPLSVRVYPPEFIYFTCEPSIQISDYDYLKGLNIGPVPAIYIQENCPLPNSSIADLLQTMNIQITNILAYTGPIPLNDSLENKHFTGLGMKHLILSFNGITTIPENFFEGLPNLRSFDLGGNKIRRLPKNLFKPIPKLKHIDVSNNDLEHLDDEIFVNLTEIYEINIRGNKLQELSRDIFSGLSSLDNLDFSNNYLETLPVDIFRDLNNLRELQMDKNNFSEIPEIFVSDFPKLKEFSLKTNKQHMKLPDYFFSNLTGLKKVRLNHNYLSSIPENFFWKCPSITNIELLENSFKSLPHHLFRDSVNLETLNLAFNQLEDLPDYVFKNLGKLNRLRLDNNRLKSLSRNVFNGLKNLKSLDLKHNRISHVDAEAFLPLQQLKDLELSDNLLSFKNENLKHQSPLQYCKNLEKLYLDENSIEEIFIDWRLNLTKLYRFDISRNNLQHLSVNDIYFLSDLVSSDFRYNNISVFDFENVEALAAGLWSTYPPRKEKGEIRVRLSGNPLNCDCRSYDFISYLGKKQWPRVNFKLTLYADDLSCKEPQGLKDVLAKNVNLEKLTCPAGEQCTPSCGKDVS